MKKHSLKIIATTFFIFCWLSVMAWSMSVGWQKPPLGTMPNLNHPLAQGLIGNWIMNQGSGNITQDYSGNGNIGVFINSPAWVPQGVRFVGASSQEINVTDNGSLRPTQGITLRSVFMLNGAWVTSDFPALIEGMEATGAGTRGYRFLNLAQSDGNQFRFRTYIGGTGFNCDATTVAVIDTLYDLVATFDGANQKVYLNGVLENTCPRSGTITQPTTPSTIIFGFLNGGGAGAYMDGDIRLNQIWSRGITETEVQWLYREPYAMFASPSAARHAAFAAAAAGGGGGGQVIMIMSQLMKNLGIME